MERSPVPGEEVAFESTGGDVFIEVAEVPSEQPLADLGIWRFADQYGDWKLCCDNDGEWEIVMENELTLDQLETLRDCDDTPAKAAR